jgi:TolB-like protein/DNA-binding SARP family transcriptional activator/Tfp pilus assembly protein PilF
MIGLRLFGGACLVDETGPLTGPVAQRRRLALLALLAASPDARMAREKLCAYLWPDSAEEEARSSLVDAVYALRKRLGRDVLVSVGAEIRLNPARIGSDVQRFRCAVAAGDHEQAVSLYTGPFLDGFFVPGADEFERWAEAERQLRSCEYARAVEALAARHDRMGESASAVDAWRRLSRHDPYSSRVALALMQALVAVGEREAAIHHAAAFQRLLREEIGSAPDAAVLMLADRLRSEPADKSGAAPGAPGVPSVVDGAAELPVAAYRARELPLPVGSAPEAAVGTPTARPQGVPRDVLRPLWFAGAAAVLLLVAAVKFMGSDREWPEPAGASVAVLPFVNLSADGEHRWFADGLTDELIGALARVEGIRVAARTSVYAYHGRNLPLQDIARQLQVRYVLEGSARRHGNEVRITAQLVDARTGYPLWAATLDRQLGDLLTVQRELALRIAESLQLELGSAAAFPGTHDSHAYDDYLQGRYHWMHGSVTDGATQERAIGFFISAVQRDPGFARAFAGLADAYSHAGQPERSREAALRALALDSTLAEARTALAYPLAFHDWRWHAAERELTRAIQLEPNAVLPYVRRANVLAALGRTEEAIADVERAARMEPLSFLVSYNRGLVHYWVGHYDEAVRFLQHTLAMDTVRLDVRRELAHAHFGRGDLEQAAALYRSAGDTIFAHLATGSRSQLEALLRAAESDTGFMTAATRAKFHARLGRHDDALRELQAAVAAPDRWIPFHLVFPVLSPLRGDPRFQQLRHQVGLEPAAPAGKSTVPAKAR